jgi:hypothetical protein
MFAGAEVVIENGPLTVAVLRSPSPPRRSIAESIALLPELLGSILAVALPLRIPVIHAGARLKYRAALECCTYSKSDGHKAHYHTDSARPGNDIYL